MINRMEKDLLISLLQNELKEFEKDKNIVQHDIVMLKGEEEYDDFLKALIGKLK
ncbi:MAG: hypothetical protein ABII01_02660 [Candidatus Woesearchaeota archaeon]